MSIYIATAISKRPEKTKIGKLAEAQGRIEQIKKELIENFNEGNDNFEIHDCPAWLSAKMGLELGENFSSVYKYVNHELLQFQELRYANIKSTFTENPITEPVSEEEAMGRCVKLVMQCDVIIIDKGINLPSKGMLVEEFVAKTYDKAIIYYHGK